MAFNAALPAASTVLSSAELRANWAAIQTSMGGRNMVADPGFYIWPAETANGAASQTVPPAHWVLSGTGATVQRCGAGLTDTNTYGSEGWATELTYSSATAYLEQNLLDGTIPTIFTGLSVALGAAVKCSTGSAARIFTHDSATGYTYSSYHSGGGAWEWLSIVGEIGASTTGVKVGLELASSSAHVQGMTGLLGDIIPLYPIPCEVQIGTYGALEGGAPTSATYVPGKIRCARPFFFTGLMVNGFTTPPSGGTYVCNVRRYDGSAWQDMLASNLSISDGHAGGGSNTVDTTYRYRCIDKDHSASSTTQTDTTMLAYNVTNGGSAAGIAFGIRGLQFNRPQDSLVAFNDPSKDGS